MLNFAFLRDKILYMLLTHFLFFLASGLFMHEYCPSVLLSHPPPAYGRQFEFHVGRTEPATPV